jgi:adenylate cyclase
MSFDKGMHSSFIGREKEFDMLKENLIHSIEGRGQLVLISGEAGIGKTRFIKEFEKYAASQDVRCLSGACMSPEASDPYLPLITALSDITTPALIHETQDFVNIDEAFLINNYGIVVSHTARIGASILDEDIVGSMLSAVQSFVKDAFGEDDGSVSGLDTLVYGTTRIIIEHGDLVFLAVVMTGGEPEGLREDVRELVQRIEKQYYSVLKDWDGTVSKVSEVTHVVQNLTTVKYRVKKAIRDIDIKREKDRVFEKVLQVILEAAKNEPIVLILEDIHWADVSSLQLLQYIARNTKESRIMICCTYRPEELDDAGDRKVHPLKETIQRMSRYKMFCAIELERLNFTEVSRMLSSIFKTDTIPSDFLQRIYGESEGNPFFIEETIYSFRDEGVISQIEDSWHFDENIDSSIPRTITDLINLRIDRLEEHTIDTIKYASVIGNEFEFDLLGQTMRIPDENLIITLENLEKNKIIQVDNDNDELYRFNHSKIREVVYKGLGKHRKRMIHEKVAMVVEDLNRETLDNVVYQLAHHYSNTKEHDKTLEFSALAGDKASRKFAFHEAYDYYKLALDAMRKMEESEENNKRKLDIMIELGDICYVIGEWDRAIDYYKQSITVSEKIGDERKKAEGYRNIGQLYVFRDEWENAISFLKEGKMISESIDDKKITADIYYYLGSVSEFKGELPMARRYYGKCMDIAVNINDQSKMAEAYLGFGRLSAKKSQYEDSIFAFKKAIEILEKIQDLSELSKAYENLGATYTYVDVDEAIKYHNKTIEIADRTGFIRMKGYSLMNIAYIFIKKNELKTASDYLEKALKIFEKLDERMLISISYINYGTIHRLRKEWDKACDYFDKALRICSELNTPYYLGYVFFEYGLMHKDKGDIDKASEHLAKALDIYKELQHMEMMKKVKEELSTISGDSAVSP